MCVCVLSFVIVTFNRINNNNNKHDDDLDMLIMSRVKKWGFINDFMVWESGNKQVPQLINYIFLKRFLICD